MKIRTWLLLSYFVVMILPSVAAYVLFVWINDFYNDLKVEEYISKRTQLQEVITVLDDPTLYRLFETERIAHLLDPQLSIVLYNRDGLILYSSDPLQASPHMMPDRERLYQNLYAFEQGYRAYTYKQPVFYEGELVGFFEVKLSREQWVAGVNARTWVIASSLFVLFALIYIIVILLVHRKLNLRLTALMEQMTAFAKGEQVKPLVVENDEIGELTQHFYDMQHQIETAQERIAKEQREKEFMVATISHDLKTPLTSIRAYAEAMASDRHLTDDERMEYRKIIIEKANYMQQMLDDLTMHIVLKSPSYHLERVGVDGSEFFEMLLSDYEPLCAEKGITLNVECKVTGHYELNPKQMIRVADNLMTNAIQHTPPSGHIGLAAIETDQPLPEWLFPFVKEQVRFDRPDGVYLIVQNEGPGIPPDQLAHVFDPLYQADQARTKKGAKGTGLGLSITKQIMEKHGGDVSFVSLEGMGTCVIGYLPKQESR
jgi:signal transduction histidine kinase